MKYSSVDRFDDFEFHDCEFTFVSWEDDRLVVSAKFLNIHKDAPQNNFGVDMELDKAQIIFHGFNIKEFEPSRTWKTDENGNSYTDDPLIIYTDDKARSMLKNELKSTAIVMGITYDSGEYELGAIGIDPYFSVRFEITSLEIVWDDYRKIAWYESPKQG